MHSRNYMTMVGRTLLSQQVQDADEVREFAHRVAGATRDTGYRPQCLLVLVNPHGGSGKAWQTWEGVAWPVFKLAGGWKGAWDEGIVCTLACSMTKVQSQPTALGRASGLE